jgi:hypothetical protein
VLEVRTCLFTSMIIDVMFIVYCCHCVVIGYLRIDDQLQVQKYSTYSKNPNFHDVDQFGVWGLGNGHWVLNKILLLKFKLFFMISNMWFTG